MLSIAWHAQGLKPTRLLLSAYLGVFPFLHLSFVVLALRAFITHFSPTFIDIFIVLSLRTQKLRERERQRGREMQTLCLLAVLACLELHCYCPSAVICYCWPAFLLAYYRCSHTPINARPTLLLLLYMLVSLFVSPRSCLHF